MNITGPKTIYELLGMNFFIPSYQRGYRWTNDQVTELLDDIYSFNPKEKEWYCLQPLVIKELSSAEKNKYLQNENINGIWYEVVDGQQRLTTIYLIIHYFNEMWEGEEKIPEPVINYETRQNENINSFKFLKNIKPVKNPESKDDSDKHIVNIDNSNIDYYHISIVFATIHEWAMKIKKTGFFERDKFKGKFQMQTRVIWYEISGGQDGRDIFKRLNMGKIPLSNAELIKALFLNSSNFKVDHTNSEIEKEHIRLKQIEIANEWDNIEYTLRNREFWFFLNNIDKNNEGKNVKDTRIEFIFELLVDKPKDSKDNYNIFREYFKRFTNNADITCVNNINEKIIAKNWEDVKRYFQTLHDWYNDRELYHKIGFLAAFNTDIIKSLLEESRLKLKPEFTAFVDSKIRDRFNKVKIDDIEYGNGKVKEILLLYNIQTMLDNTEENSRFPFDRFKNEEWHEEHIHAVASEIPKTEQHQKDWLNQAKEFINKENTDLLKRIENCTENDFNDLFLEILNYFSKNGKLEEINDLSNLVLLDAKTNTSYKNVVFPVKRKTIIEREKDGTFIPICTRNVFLKYYSENVDQMTFWDETDRSLYKKNIKEVLEKYLPDQGE